MAQEDKVQMTGSIVEAFRGGMYRVELDNGHETLGYVSGKMRRYRIRINPGDRVTVELSPYDLTRGRITFRERRRNRGKGKQAHRETEATGRV